MQKQNKFKKRKGQVSRRDFLKAAGMSAMGLLLQGLPKGWPGAVYASVNLDFHGSGAGGALADHPDRQRLGAPMRNPTQ